MVAFKVPATSPAVLTVAMMVPLPEPEAGLRVSQAALSLAVQVKVPPSVFAMLMSCAAGLVPPAVPEKLRLVGFRSRLGVVVVPPVETTNVTGIVAVRITLYLPVILMSRVLL